MRDWKQVVLMVIAGLFGIWLIVNITVKVQPYVSSLNVTIQNQQFLNRSIQQLDARIQVLEKRIEEKKK